MFRYSGFTQKANNAINVAMDQASLMGHTYVGTEHMLLGLFDQGSGIAHAILSKVNVTFEGYRNRILSVMGQRAKTIITPDNFTPHCK